MKNRMEFDPEAYTISIRKETIEDEVYYVGRVAELPNITAFESTYSEAYAIVIDAIRTFKAIADETNENFPLPYHSLSDEFSGRITLRIPQSLHAKVSYFATKENVSINQYLTTAIASYVGESGGISKVTMMAKKIVEQIVTSTSISMKSTSNKYNVLTDERFQYINLVTFNSQTTEPSLIEIGR